MTGEEILAIQKCGDLFPQDEQQVKDKYKELAKRWHPDSNSAAIAPHVFAKINLLYRQAMTCLEEKTWEKTNYLLITKQDGKRVVLNYDWTFSFELGECYVCRRKVVYVLRPDKEKYYKNALARLKAIHYQDERMKEKLRMSMPVLYGSFQSSKEEYVIVFDKKEEVVPLKAAWMYYEEKMDPRAVAWIISRLSSLTCFLGYNGIVHNGISLDHCLIDPTSHDVILMGGWWYAVEDETQMLGTTKEIFSIMSVKAKSSKLASRVTDLESVKLLGRQLLGEVNVRKLNEGGYAPQPFIEFLCSGSGSDCYEEFEKWDAALDRAFEKRKFVPMLIDHLYEKIKER